MYRHILTIMALILFQAGVGLAAGPFDGEWSGSFGSGDRLCNFGGSIIAKVEDGKLTGQLRSPTRHPFGLTGTISPDGTFIGSMGAGGRISLFGKVEENYLETYWMHGKCRNVIQIKRQ